MNSDWVKRSLYVSLGSHRYGTLKGNLAYVPVMDSEFGSWQLSPKELYKDQTKLKRESEAEERENTSEEHDGQDNQIQSLMKQILVRMRVEVR